MERLIEIHKRLPHTHLVMHGSSSVPKDLQDIINQYGGKLKPTWGVPVEEIQLGIKNGVRKINVDTDNRLAITGAIRKVFMEKPEEFDPRSYMKPAREAMKKVVAQRMTQFGQAGHAERLRADPAGGDGQAVRNSRGVNLPRFTNRTPWLAWGLGVGVRDRGIVRPFGSDCGPSSKLRAGELRYSPLTARLLQCSGCPCRWKIGRAWGAGDREVVRPFGPD